MKGLLILSVICVQFYASYGHPSSRGGGVYSYSDSTGNRYGGSYDLQDGQVTGFKGDAFPIPNYIPNFNFFPPNFMNYGNFIPPGFPSLASKKIESANPKKKSDSSHTVDKSKNPTFDSRFNPFMNNGGLPGFGGMPGFGMPNFGASNLASSGAATGPGFLHQFASINPVNPAIPNIDIMNRFAEVPEGDGTKPNYYSVSSSSYSSSSNLNGKELANRGAETVVNENGKITKYSVHS